MYTHENISVETLTDTARGFVSEDADAPTLECDACGRRQDTYLHACDNATVDIADFLGHCAYDHAGRASVIEYRVSRVFRIV